jgi:CRISPR/Cas system CSM-associated protein Csm4 (group 5 of RAMP superfamily)
MIVCVCVLVIVLFSGKKSVEMEKSVRDQYIHETSVFFFHFQDMIVLVLLIQFPTPESCAQW